MSAQFVRHVRGHLVGRALGDAVEDVPDEFLRGPETDIDDKTAAQGDHQPGGVSAADKRGANASVHHAGPAVERLLPEGERPGERTALDHALVAAPRRVDQEVESAARLGDSGEDRAGLLVVLVIAGEPGHRSGKLGGVDGPAGAKHREAGVGQRDRHAASDAAAGAGDEGDRHVSTSASPRRRRPEPGPDRDRRKSAASRRWPAAGGFSRPDRGRTSSA